MEHQPPYDYQPIGDRAFELPDGQRVALWVIPNIEHMRFDRPDVGTAKAGGDYVPDVHNFAWREYGLRVGIWRLMEVLDRHDVPATVALNAEVIDHEPAIIEAALARGWAFMGHGLTNSIRLSDLDRDEERELIEATRDRIEARTGSAPAGWLSPGLVETYHTVDLLASAGYSYVCDWCNDDQPYTMSAPSGDLLSVPYTTELNDIPWFLGYGLDAPAFETAIRDQFDVLYKVGAREGNAKVMAIALHPFITGHAYRVKYLDRALEYITGHDGVWVTTGDEIARHAAGA